MENSEYNRVTRFSEVSWKENHLLCAVQVNVSKHVYLIYIFPNVSLCSFAFPSHVIRTVHLDLYSLSVLLSFFEISSSCHIL